MKFNALRKHRPSPPALRLSLAPRPLREREVRTILRWPADERPRERLARSGPSALSPAELLALLLGHGRPGATAVDVARELLLRFGGPAGVAGAGGRELAAVAGVGPAKAARIRAAFALADRAAAEGRAEAAELPDGAAVARRFAPLARRRRERCVAVLLNARNRIVGERLVSLGTVGASLVGCREVFREAIRGAAAGLILVHNHPSGDPRPSHEDRKSTARLRAVGELVGIPLLDHVIVARKGFTSFAEVEHWHRPRE